jgi:hypothetical protein
VDYKFVSIKFFVIDAIYSKILAEMISKFFVCCYCIKFCSIFLNVSIGPKLIHKINYMYIHRL